MKIFKITDKNSFVAGMVLMGVVMGVVVYFMYVRIQEVHQFIPKVIYNDK
jgi:hypothetical protein